MNKYRKYLKDVRKSIDIVLVRNDIEETKLLIEKMLVSSQNMWDLIKKEVDTK